ncbi:zinc finger MYND domain-containing protein 10 [Marchantia polymorpha subsp. ruderalis]|uniref:MYND-type domain-containing protein n=2 Tax=Marchantia polymorpha TaxID=3197 RepID=A0AAF6BTW6_MARPO|nr:hypothetical protein MARPO_0045s0093 [Marchantia polymorpha]BBN15450.1 hypothetical protein Mp_6g19700 [Marchantia polymorpha subsp. ruderalis]|eukprot:PTQ39438.1 hypothetical protein MARPO_0045s0093 [Marchantia polymorpha]
MEPCAAMRPAFLKGDEGTLLTSHEAEYIVEHLSCLGIDQVGSAAWIKQHANLEKLNLQAHYNTMALCDEFVMAALISHNKMDVLIHELLVIEIWLEKVFPHLLPALAVQATTMTLGLLLYHEATIINLLEVALFHSEACEALGSDALLELADYTYRKVVYLNTKAWEDASAKERTASEMVNLKPEEEVEDKVARNRFCAGVCALSVLRYLTDYISSLSPCVMARLLDCHDVVMALIPLVESAPWTRKRKSGDKRWVEKYSKGKWSEVPPADRYLLVEPDVQLWLAINNLLVDLKCRNKYAYDSYRRSQVLKLHKYVNDLLLDQLPVLKDLRWVLEELQLKILNTDPDRGGLILEQVPALRESMLRRDDWQELAQKQLLTILANEAPNQSAMNERVLEMMRMFEFGELMEPPTCAACGGQAVNRCSRCKTEWYCGKACQVRVWQKHKKACELLVRASHNQPNKIVQA